MGSGRPARQWQNQKIPGLPGSASPCAEQVRPAQEHRRQASAAEVIVASHGTRRTSLHAQRSLTWACGLVDNAIETFWDALTLYRGICRAWRAKPPRAGRAQRSPPATAAEEYRRHRRRAATDPRSGPWQDAQCSRNSRALATVRFQPARSSLQDGSVSSAAPPADGAAAVLLMTQPERPGPADLARVAKLRQLRGSGQRSRASARVAPPMRALNKDRLGTEQLDRQGL